jgi:hypothetical protein
MPLQSGLRSYRFLEVRLRESVGPSAVLTRLIRQNEQDNLNMWVYHVLKSARNQYLKRTSNNQRGR